MTPKHPQAGGAQTDLIQQLEAEAITLAELKFPELSKLLLDARDEIERLRGGGWLPIESAPREIEPNTKCGEVIMLGGPGWASQGFYHDGSHCYGHRGEAGFFDSEDWGPDRLLTASNVHPTHWQPMIEPPAAPEPVAVG